MGITILGIWITWIGEEGEKGRQKTGLVLSYGFHKQVEKRQREREISASLSHSKEEAHTGVVESDLC